MNNNETNTCVYKEYERLKGLFLGGNEDKLPLVDELYNDCVKIFIRTVKNDECYY